MSHFRLGLAFACVGLLGSVASGGDWPQILGPTRNGVALDEQIRRDWDGRTPRTLWEHTVGEGYAGVAVVDGRVIVFHRLANQDVVESLDAATGASRWKAEWPTRYRGGIDPDMGPRCVPLVHEGSVYLHGVSGQLVCLNLVDGKQKWRRDTRADFRFPEGFFGAGSSPIVIADRLLLNVGGRDDGGIVAFSLATGETIWQATDEGASYSSPVATTIGGQPAALFVTRLSFLGIDPRDGRVLFRIPFGRAGSTVNGASPLVVDESHVLLTANYGVGGRLARISSGEAEVVWNSGDVLSSQYPTPLLFEEAVYGMDGREDIGVPSLRCLDPKTGKIHWSQDGFGMATLILAGDLLLVMKTDGELLLVEPTTESYRELARFQLFDGTTRALPALSDGKLYVRDSSVLKCFELR